MRQPHPPPPPPRRPAVGVLGPFVAVKVAVKVRVLVGGVAVGVPMLQRQPSNGMHFPVTICPPEFTRHDCPSEQIVLQNSPAVGVDVGPTGVGLGVCVRVLVGDRGGVGDASGIVGVRVTVAIAVAVGVAVFDVGVSVAVQVGSGVTPGIGPPARKGLPEMKMSVA